ncbi:MAG: carbohydrate ABC transporter permease [Pseudomonadota bacterium]
MSRLTSTYLVRGLVWLMLVIFAVYFLLPVYVLLVNSVKGLAEIHTGTILALPNEVDFGPWLAAWSEHLVGTDAQGLRPFFFNSLMIVVPSALISTGLGAINGYVLSLYSFRGDWLVYFGLLMSAFIPFQMVLIPMAGVLGWLGLAGSIPGLIFVHVIYGMGISTVFFRGFYRAFSKDVVSAGRIDGAGFFTLFRRILLPPSAPIIAMSLIWQFTAAWNDYLFGLTFSGVGSQPVMVGLFNMVSVSHGVANYNVYFAAALQASLPTLAIYLIFGRYFVAGLLSSTAR